MYIQLSLKLAETSPYFAGMTTMSSYRREGDNG